MRSTLHHLYGRIFKLRDWGTNITIKFVLSSWILFERFWKQVLIRFIQLISSLSCYSRDHPMSNASWSGTPSVLVFIISNTFNMYYMPWTHLLNSVQSHNLFWIIPMQIKQCKPMQIKQCKRHTTLPLITTRTRFPGWYRHSSISRHLPWIKIQKSYTFLNKNPSRTQLILLRYASRFANKLTQINWPL